VALRVKHSCRRPPHSSIYVLWPHISHSGPIPYVPYFCELPRNSLQYSYPNNQEIGTTLQYGNQEYFSLNLVVTYSC
jgi:hypothetical protein